MLKLFEVDWADVVRQSVEELQRREERRKERLAAEATLRQWRERRAAGDDSFRDWSLSGNPPALLLDPRLTPLERNTWHVLYHLLIERRVLMPRYEDLQPYLATSPCGQQASRETIARALIVLRLTRWLSLVKRERDAQGCLRGCIYTLHDRVLKPSRALRLDPDYLLLLQQGLTHAAKGVRDVARHVLGELQQDPDVPAETLARLLTEGQVEEQKVLDLISTQPAQTPSPAQTSAPRAVTPVRNTDSVLQHSERGDTHRVRDANPVQQNSEPSRKQPVSPGVRLPNAGGTVQEPQSNKKTVPRANASGTEWPDALPLTAGERRLAQHALSSLEPEERQAVINEAAVRCAGGGIRRPGAYLMGLIKRACAGEFTLWAARGAGQEAPAAKARRTPASETRPASALRPREASPLALACLNELKQRCRLIPHLT